MIILMSHKNFKKLPKNINDIIFESKIERMIKNTNFAWEKKVIHIQKNNY